MRYFASVLVLTMPALPAFGAVGISPAYQQLVPRQSINFLASGAPVIWQVDNVVGGNATFGTITQAGVFTAPSTLPTPAAVTVTAVSATDPNDVATATITVLAQAATGITRYVATGGRDTNPGTLAAPFATLQHAADLASPGDTVLVRGGIYSQLLTPTRSGNASAGPITIASYPGETATLDGTGLAIPNGQNGLVTLNNISSVIVQGFELRNYTTASLAQVPVGMYVTGAGDGVQLVGNHVHNITTTAVTNANQCGSNALGVAVYGNLSPAAITRLVISGNEIDHLKTGCSESMSINGNVSNFVVMNNRVHDNNNIGIDAIGFEGVSPKPATDQARGGEIRGNLVYNITSYGNPDYGNQYASDGIYVDGGTNIVIEQNIVHDTDFGIELASEHYGRTTSNVIARNNVIHDDNASGITIGGYGAARGGTAQCMIVGNTLFRNDTKNTGSGEIQIQYHAAGNTIENNIVSAGSQGLLLNSYTASATVPASLDHNLYFVPSGSQVQYVWKAKHYASLSSYQAAASQDSHSTFADPHFISTTTPNLDLQADSIAVNAGILMPATVIGNADILGKPRVTNGAVSEGAYQK